MVVWLGDKFQKFQFQYPGALSHSRFCMQSIYSVKTYLLSRQIDIYSEDEMDEIKNVAMFVGLFHAPCSNSTLSPR